VAFVAGASEGIGAAIVRALTARGAAVVGMARRPEPGAALEAEIKESGAYFRFVQGDVVKPADCEAAVAQTLRQHDALDVVVNNVGVSLPPKRIEDFTDDEWDGIVNPTLRGAFNVIRAALPHLRRQGHGHVINVASMAGVQPLAYLGPYSLAKAAVIHLTKVVAVENVDAGIRANCVIVGGSRTPQGSQGAQEIGRFLNGPDWVPSQAGAKSPMASALILSDAIAAAVASLCADDALEINGSEIRLDKGLTIGRALTDIAYSAYA
jgi:NAD(P)-dependent dehydrogenase (short-subunit alcohol dehydrogenase family)